jgi:hypothetical protein
VKKRKFVFFCDEAKEKKTKRTVREVEEAAAAAAAGNHDGVSVLLPLYDLL